MYYVHLYSFGFNLVFRSIAHRSAYRRTRFSDQRENLHYWIDNRAREILFGILCAAISSICLYIVIYYIHLINTSVQKPFAKALKPSPVRVTCYNNIDNTNLQGTEEIYFVVFHIISPKNFLLCEYWIAKCVRFCTNIIKNIYIMLIFTITRWF